MAFDSSKATPKHKLPQWESADKPDRGDFNDAFAEIDQALANKVNLSGASFTGAISAPQYTTVSDANTLYHSFLRTDGTVLGRILYAGDNNTIRIRLASVEGGNDFMLSSTAISPNLSGKLKLGSAIYKWDNAYLNTAPIVGSDQRIKKDISTLEIGLITKLLSNVVNLVSKKP